MILYIFPSVKQYVKFKNVNLSQHQTVKCFNFFSIIIIAVLQCLQLDSRKRSVYIIIFSLHLSCLLRRNFESSQAVNVVVEGFSIWIFSVWMLPKNNDTKGSLKELILFPRDTIEFEQVSVHNFLGRWYILRTTVPFVTAHLEIFHCTHHPGIPESELVFYFLFYLKCIV